MDWLIAGAVLVVVAGAVIVLWQLRKLDLDYVRAECGKAVHEARNAQMVARALTDENISLKRCALKSWDAIQRLAPETAKDMTPPPQVWRETVAP